MPVVINGSTGLTANDGSVFTDASGNVGIGTSSPSALGRLTLSSSASSNYTTITAGSVTSLVGTDSSGLALSALGANNVVLYTGGTERMRIDSSGNVGIGTSSPGEKLSVAGNINVTGDGYLYSFNGGSSGQVRAGIQCNGSSQYLLFATATNERMRLDSSGRLGIGTTAPDCALTIGTNPGTGGLVVHLTRPGIADSVLVYASDAYSPNGAAATIRMGNIVSTGRSINAGGTINASGADYAEYMTKAGDFTIAKGDVCGIDANGKLTNVFADAVAFVVKSTDPSYVGGDRWGNEDALGMKEPKPLAGDATDEEKAQYDADKAAFEAVLEAARQKVDRIAFSGQVPVNVLGATPGQYIIPVDDNGGIKGVAKSEADMSLAEYMRAVGKVIAVEADGRAKIIVKVA